MSEVATMLHVIDRAARDPSVDIVKIEKLMEMAEAMKHRDSERVFNESMARVQGQMRSIAADSNNPQTKSRYASYFTLDKAIRPIYSEQGFALSFNTEDGAAGDHVRVVCYVTHGGYTRRYHIDMPADGKGAKGGDVMTKTHAMGSAMTYGQRYLLKMIFNIAIGDDDDGNRASAPRQQSRVPSPSEEPAPAAKTDAPPVHVEPYFIAGVKGETPQSWAAKYEKAISGAKSLAELQTWDDLNDKTLQMLDDKAPKEYQRLLQVVAKISAAIVPPKEDPISSGPAKSVVPSPTPDKSAQTRPGGYPDPSMSPDDFLKFCDRRMATINDAEELALVWEAEIDPAADGLFPPDFQELQSMLGRHEKRLGAD
jgi:hypothetical protein